MTAERMIDMALATLQAQLPGVIATLNAEPGAVQLVAPAAYWFAGRDPIVDYPAVEVAIADVDLGNFDFNHQDTDATTPVIVGAWMQDADYELLMRRCYRMGRALKRVMLQRDSCGDGTNPIRAQFRYRPIQPDNRGGDIWTSAAVLYVTVEHTEAVAE